MDDRAVSATLGYALSLTIAVLLVSGIFVAAADFVGNERERAIRSELEVVGNRIAADLSAVDRMVIAANESGSARISTDLPEFAAGRQYTIDVTELSGDQLYAINLTTDDPDVSVTVRVRTRTDLAESTVSGGDVEIVYTGSKLEVRRE